MKIKTIDVIAKEWLDKINGNSYFSMNITINYGMKNEKSFFVPMQYGYGDHYREMAFSQLQERKLIPEDKKLRSYRKSEYYEKHNIIVRYVKHENCLKRDLKY